MDVVSLAHFTFNNKVIGDGHTLTVVLDETAFVDQFADRFQVGVTPGNVGFGNTQHVDGSLVQFDEDTIVDLTQAEQLQNLAYLRGNLVNTRKQLQ